MQTPFYFHFLEKKEYTALTGDYLFYLIFNQKLNYFNTDETINLFIEIYYFKVLSCAVNTNHTELVRNKAKELANIFYKYKKDKSFIKLIKELEKITSDDIENDYNFMNNSIIRFIQHKSIPTSYRYGDIVFDTCRYEIEQEKLIKKFLTYDILCALDLIQQFMNINTQIYRELNDHEILQTVLANHQPLIKYYQSIVNNSDFDSEIKQFLIKDYIKINDL